MPPARRPRRSRRGARSSRRWRGPSARASPAVGWRARADATPIRRRTRRAPNATSGAHPSAPAATATANASTPHHAGQNNRSRSSSCDALRHGSTGATAIRNSNAMPIGSDSRSKYGAPTTVRRLSSASMISGNTVPSSTMKAKIANTTLLARNAPSRDTGESITPGDRSRSPRHAIIASEATTTNARKPSR